MQLITIILCLVALLSPFNAKATATSTSTNPPPYDYPFVNPYESTVLGTPSLYKSETPAKPREKLFKITVFNNRKIPKVFWYHDKFQFSLAWQKKRAPLIFNIAGTGSGYDSSTMKNLQKILFNAGFHVVSLSSPTYPNFIVTASKTMVPGYIQQDAEDLYRVMQLAWEHIQEKIKKRCRSLSLI